MWFELIKQGWINFLKVNQKIKENLEEQRCLEDVDSGLGEDKG
jgi:hypothetical protein